jgi:hypothetical protein
MARRAQAEGALLGLVEVHGGGALSRSRAAFDLRLAIHDLQKLAVIGGAPPDLGASGSLEGSLQVEGDLFGSGPLHARLGFPTVDLELGGRRISALEPVALELAGCRLDVRSFYLGDQATGSEVVVSGRVELTGDRALDLRVQASLPASVLAGSSRARRLGTIGARAIRGTLAPRRADAGALRAVIVAASACLRAVGRRCSSIPTVRCSTASPPTRRRPAEREGQSSGRARSSGGS